MFRDGEIDCQHLQVCMRGSRYACRYPGIPLEAIRKVSTDGDRMFVFESFIPTAEIQTSIQSDRCVNMSTFSRFREEGTAGVRNYGRGEGEEVVRSGSVINGQGVG